MAKTKRGEYAALIDEQVWAFIEASVRCFPADAALQSMAVQRSLYNAMSQQFYAGRPTDVSTRDYALLSDEGHSIRLREYQFKGDPSGTDAGSQAGAQIVYFHGGGFVVGDLESHDDVCAEICAQSGLLVTAVDYRLAPEHCYPAAFNDAYFSYHQVLARNQLPVILMGDSAGANLAASVAHRIRGQGRQAIGQLLIYPVLGSDFSQGTYLKHANAPLLSTDDMRFYQRQLLNGDAPLDNDLTLPKESWFAPLEDSDFNDLPPTKVFTAQCDPLAGDGLAYCQRIQAAGGIAQCFKEKGLVHGYLRARHCAVAAKDSFDRILKVIADFY